MSARAGRGSRARRGEGLWGVGWSGAAQARGRRSGVERKAETRAVSLRACAAPSLCPCPQPEQSAPEPVRGPAGMLLLLACVSAAAEHLVASAGASPQAREPGLWD